MAIKYFEFNGKKSTDFNIYIQKATVYGGPEKDYDAFEVPGKSGDLLYYNGRMKNIIIKYECFIRSRDISADIQNIKDWLYPQHGYQELRDTYNPGYYRMAYFTGPYDVETQLEQRFGTFEITFNCRPQKYIDDGLYYYCLKNDYPRIGPSGERSWEHSISSENRLFVPNKTPYTASPLIKIEGSGKIEYWCNYIENYSTKTTQDILITVNLPSGKDAVYIDCENFEIYFEDKTSATKYVSFVQCEGHGLINPDHDYDVTYLLPELKTTNTEEYYGNSFQLNYDAKNMVNAIYVYPKTFVH